MLLSILTSHLLLVIERLCLCYIRMNSIILACHKTVHSEEIQVIKKIKHKEDTGMTIPKRNETR